MRNASGNALILVAIVALAAVVIAVVILASGGEGPTPVPNTGTEQSPGDEQEGPRVKPKDGDETPTPPPVDDDVKKLVEKIRKEPREAELDDRLKAIKDLAARARTDGEAFAHLVQLAYEDRYVQKYIVRALGATGRAEAVEVLEAFIAYKVPGVARFAAEALAMIDTEASVGVLLQGFAANVGRHDGYDEEIRREIVTSLMKLKATTAVGTLAPVLDSEEDLMFKNHVAYTLGRIGSKDALPALRRHLARLKAHEPEEALVRGAWEEAVQIAEEAIEAIGK
ncbi:MAG: HEAT repeat domain-containing protein [Planctomycetota bacterium]|jgi:HEAT repeat protein